MEMVEEQVFPHGQRPHKRHNDGLLQSKGYLGNFYYGFQGGGIQSWKHLKGSNLLVI